MDVELPLQKFYIIIHIHSFTYIGSSISFYPKIYQYAPSEGVDSYR